MKRYFYRASDKRFWSIEDKGTSYNISYGVSFLKKSKFGSKSFSSVETCQKNIEKEIQKKLDDNYIELTIIDDFSEIDHIVKVWEIQQAQKHLPIKFNLYNSFLIKEVCKITSLQELLLKNVIELPNEIGQLHNLKKLHIHFKNPNGIIPNALGRLTQLEELKLEGVSRINDNIGDLENLNTLNIQFGWSVDGILPESIGRLKKLRELNMSYVAQIPDTIWELENLMELGISHSKIKNIPEELGNLEKLYEFHLHMSESDDLAGQSLVLPQSIGKLKNLTELVIYGYKVENLPESFKDLIELEMLVLELTNLDKIPDAIFHLENLTRLNIDVKNMDYLDPRLAQLKKLNWVNFYNMEDGQFKNVPEELSARFKKSRDWNEIKNHILGNALPENKILPTPTKEEKEKALADRKEEWSFFEDKSFNKRKYQVERFEEVVSFLKGETDKCPLPDSVDFRSIGVFESIFILLKPFPQWDFMDERILTFISQDDFSFKGMLTWLHKISSENPNMKFEDILSELEKYDIKKKNVLSRCLTKNSTILPNGKPTSLGTYILEHFEDSPEYFIELAKNQHRKALVELFIKHRSASIEPYLPQLYLDTYDDGSNHLPYEMFDALLEHNAAKYSKILFNLMDTLEPRCRRNCRMEAARLLVEKGDDKYRTFAFGIVEETLQHISDFPENKFMWSLGTYVPSFIDWIFTHYAKSALPAVEKYVRNTKKIDINIIKLAVKHLKEDAMDMVGEAFKVSFYEGGLTPLRYYIALFDALSNIDYTPYHEEVWKLLESDSPELRLLACKEIIKFGAQAVVPRGKALLKDDNADNRELGIRLLLPFEETWGELMVVMDNEKNEDLRNLLVKKFYAVPTQITIAEAKRRVSNATERGKLSRKPAKWLDISKLPTLKWNNGEELEEKELLYLFYRQKSWDDISPDPEARDMYALIEKKSTKGLSPALLKLVKENGGIMAKNRFVLSIIGILGEDSIVNFLEKEAISGTNPNACMVLGLVGTIRAARALDNITNYFSIKYPNVREAAETAFEQIADTKGMLIQELKDAIIPDFGFKGLTKKIKDGDATYDLSIDRSLGLVFEDAKGKRTKSIPQTISSKMKDSIVALEEEIKKAVKQSSTNMEKELCNQGVWPLEEWEKRFFKNPLAFALAQNFIWGTYQNGNLCKNFMVDEQGKLLNRHGETIKLGSDELVVLAHPLNLESTEKNQWSAIFEEKKIAPPFPQLDRKVYTLSDDNKEKTFDHSYASRNVPNGDFKYRAAKLGWRRGSILDGGEVSSYKKSIPVHNLEAFIMLKGVNVQNLVSEGESIERLFFVPLDSVHTGTDTINEPRSGDDHRLIPFGEVPPVVYSEVVRDIESILEQ